MYIYICYIYINIFYVESSFSRESYNVHLSVVQFANGHAASDRRAAARLSVYQLHHLSEKICYDFIAHLIRKSV